MVKKRERDTPRSPSGRNRPNYQVFVSHATADKWVATVICEKIEATGASTFRDDRDIDGGDDIPENIRQQITRSREMVVLLTPESVDRQWVSLEVGAAWGRRSNYRIVTILDHVGTDRIPELIKSKRAIRINDIDLYLRNLSSRVKKAKDGKN